MTARNNLVTLVLIGCFAGSWSGVPALSDIRAGRGCTVAVTNRNRARTTNPTRRQVHVPELEESTDRLWSFSLRPRAAAE